MMENSDKHQEWIKKRKLTTIAFAIQTLFVGCDYGIFTVNLWLYITEEVKPQHPKLFYSLISVAYLLSAAASSIFICRLADATRRIRLIMFLSNTALIAGNLIYMIPFSPFFLLFGRIIAAAGQTERSVMAGELGRCYPDKEVASVFSIMGAAHSFGFMIAPGLNVMFSSTSIWLGRVHITYANVSGLYMAVIFLLAQLLVQFMVSNLSLEYDLKQKPGEETSTPSNEDVVQPDAEKNVVPKGNIDEDKERQNDETEGTIFFIFSQLFTHYDTTLLLGLQFLETFFVFSMDMCLPILIIERLHWSHTAYNIIMLGTGLFSILPCVFLMFRNLTDHTIYYIALPSVLAFALLQLVQMVWQLGLCQQNVNIFLSVLYSVLFTDIVLIRDIFVGSFLARMVSSRFKSTGDGIRLAVSRLGAIVAMSTAAYGLPKIQIVGTVLIGAVIIFAVLLFLRRRTMKNPKVIIS